MSRAAHRNPAASVVSVAVGCSAELLTPTESKERPALIHATLKPAAPATSVSFFDSLIRPKFERDPFLLLLAILCGSCGVRFEGLQQPAVSDSPLVVFTTSFGASGAVSLANFGTNPLMRHVENIYARFGKTSPYLPKQNAARAASGDA